jgi:hypothetical protein
MPAMPEVPVSPILPSGRIPGSARTPLTPSIPERVPMYERVTGLEPEAAPLNADSIPPMPGIQNALPSGRVPGSIAAQAPPPMPEARTPIWQKSDAPPPMPVMEQIGLESQAPPPMPEAFGADYLMPEPANVAQYANTRGMTAPGLAMPKSQGRPSLPPEVAAEALGDLGTADLKTTPEPTVNPFEVKARDAKAKATAKLLQQHGITPELANAMDDADWGSVEQAMGKKFSPESRAAVLEELHGMKPPAAPKPKRGPKLKLVSKSDTPTPGPEVNSDIVPERTLYHGTSAPEFEKFKGMTYLTDDPFESSAYAGNVIGAGRRGGTPRILDVKTAKGRTLNINEAVTDALMDGDDVDAVIVKKGKEAKNAGYRYIEFEHPGISKDVIPVTVSLYPEDLSIQNSTHVSKGNSNMLGNAAAEAPEPPVKNTKRKAKPFAMGGIITPPKKAGRYSRRGIWYGSPKDKPSA